MRTLTTVAIVALFGTFAPPVAADELPLGTWTGSAVRVNRNNQNRQPRVLIVRKVPDQHVVWRGGSGELISVSFGQNQNNAIEVATIALGDDRLTFSYTTPNQETATCVLLLQSAERTYVGDCRGDGDWRVTLTPPAAVAAKPAEAK